MKLEFIQAAESDKNYLLELRRHTMIKHFSRAGLFLSDDEHIKRLNYKYEYSYLIYLDNKRIGFVKYHSTDSELELIQVQIEPKHQGKGYGTGVVEKILDIGKNKIIKLSVLKNNPALDLYKRLGFQTVGEDKYEYHMKNKL